MVWSCSTNKMKNAYKIFVGKIYGRRHLGIRRYRSRIIFFFNWLLQSLSDLGLP
jgi:hypothetical protein